MQPSNWQHAMPLDFAVGNALSLLPVGSSLALPAQRPLDSLPVIADLLDGFFHRRLRTARLPGLVACLVVLSARDTRPILLASSAPLLLCLCHPALLCSTESDV